MTPSVGPAVLDGWMRPFRCHFTAAAWRHVLVLVCGALLAPGRRTVAAALRVMGLGEAAGFAVYHRVLSHGHWGSRALAHRLLLLLVAAFVPDGPVVVGLDDTIERRRGACIRAKGIYRDPVRSSRGHFVKASGLRWLCVMLLARWSALRPNPVGWLRLGPALPDRAGALRALRRQAGQAAQEAHGLGPAGPAAGCPLAAGTTRRGGGRQQLLGHRPAARPRAALDRGHPSAPRCLPVRSTSAAPTATARATAGHRGSAAQPGRTAAQPAHTLAPGQPRGLVRPQHPPARHRLRHRALAPSRQASGDPLGAGARSKR
jgi:DDE superfamily endonuclease